MPRFFFDLHGGGQEAAQDAVGELFATLVEARAHALTKLPIMGVELPLGEGEFRTWTATVRDENGDPVCRYILSILADPIGSAAERVLRPM